LSQLFIIKYTSKILLALQLASQNDLREIRMLESWLVILLQYSLFGFVL
jgi:hypothetical protein